MNLKIIHLKKHSLVSRRVTLSWNGRLQHVAHEINKFKSVLSKIENEKRLS